MQRGVLLIFGCIRLRFGQGCGQTLFDSVGVTTAVPADSNAAMTLKRPKEASCVKLSANALVCMAAIV